MLGLWYRFQFGFRVIGGWLGSKGQFLEILIDEGLYYFREDY